VYHGLDRLHRSGEPVEVKQGLGRENTGDPDLVVAHGSSRQVGVGTSQISMIVHLPFIRPTPGG
jgi:hypothetical protein